jgi:hypothetical protein
MILVVMTMTMNNLLIWPMLEFREETVFPSSPDDAAHVFLADLCHCIGAPLYAYDEILKWAQESYLSGYHFPTNAPSYRHLISSLQKCLNLSHLSHGTATILKSGGGTLDFPTFYFRNMFLDLITVFGAVVTNFKNLALMLIFYDIYITLTTLEFAGFSPFRIQLTPLLSATHFYLSPRVSETYVKPSLVPTDFSRAGNRSAPPGFSSSRH